MLSKHLPAVTTPPKTFVERRKDLLNRAVVDGLPHQAAARQCLERAPETLASWSLTASQSTSVATLYLAEVGLRYLADGQRHAGALGGDIASWILPALRYQQLRLDLDRRSMQ